MSIKYRQKKPLLGWCSGNKDNTEDRFIQIGISLFEHPNVISLKASELKLYFLMVKVAGQRREFTLPRSEYAPYFAPATFHDARNGLIKKEFIELVYSGKSTREPSKYRFAFGWKEH
jgi:hypothetical protein